ncbi:FAD/NAD(P)-binding domain-containing protein [Aspergillus steynii IBT 23096]|uniref:FAD/NAD(P)-binding domain-containing protein n=1 Tax=Aspergillus steynii IBT 23096 TaxID=1392250 RepID=A0A2I2G600_9EURO|nr:FAD/NAD(P)-binding domain-containing protein [Aspergillus steynii IBT 23096]PLB48304.1 FAD/NAD(P)-binding domain-containing protein [Aspergillus steynii IBT 23096]
MALEGDKGLRILIAGAGIGGLFAGIALRQAGHCQIFESSRFATELGAAIHLPPNVNGLLRRYGMKAEDFQCNNAQFATVFDSQGNTVSSKDVRGLQALYPFPWQLSHRIDLHETLKAKATSPEGPGTPVTIHLRCKVVTCDPDVPSLTLGDGRVIQGDLVIGADGVHSVLRSIISQEDIQPQPSGGSAFRFLIPISKVEANPETRNLVARPGEIQRWDGVYKRLVIYPCRNNTELNFVCLHPDAESQNSTEGWNIAGSRDHLLEVYREFHPSMKALLAMADPASIKLWRLLDRKPLATWVHAKACLLGDAAHPFLPYQGQGGAQAIEDGAALAALLPVGTCPGDVPARLKLYMKCRYERATLVQDLSRQAAFKVSADDDVGGTSTDPLEFMKINFGHDAFDHATRVLFKTYGISGHRSTLDISFGPPMPLPRGYLDSLTNTPSLLEVRFRTRRNYLETLLPDFESRIAAPGGWATASWVVRHARENGCAVKDHSLTSVALCIHDALRTADATEKETLQPVVFTTDPDFILAAGREMDAPLMLAEINVSGSGMAYNVRLGKRGRVFMEISVRGQSLTNGSKSRSGDEEQAAVSKASVSMTRSSPAELEIEFPGMGHVLRRLQGLDMHEMEVVSSV